MRSAWTRVTLQDTAASRDIARGPNPPGLWSARECAARFRLPSLRRCESKCERCWKWLPNAGSPSRRNCNAQPSRRRPHSPHENGREQGPAIIHDATVKVSIGIWPIEMPRLSIHRVEELAVAFGLAQLVEQELDRIDGTHRVEDAAKDVHLLERVARHQQFFLAGSRPGDVDCREGPLVGHLAVEDDFRVTRALELLEDHFVHARACVDQGGRDDGERTAFLDIAGGAEEALGTLQGV